jgi:hypothetical protein
MLNAKDVVGALMQNVLAGSSQSRIEHALSDRGLGQPGGLLAQLLGGATSGSGTGTGGMLGSLAALAKSMLSGAGPAGGSGNPLAAGGLGALVGALLGGGGAVKGALGGGAMALLGSLGLEALQGLSGQPSGSAPAALPAG